MLIGLALPKLGYAAEFMQDVADRVAIRIQLTADGHGAYLSAVDGAFGPDVDYAVLIKRYGETPEAGLIGNIRRRLHRHHWQEDLGPPQCKLCSTSFGGKHNQSMRQRMKRFTRLTAAHSKKLENHIHMVQLVETYENSTKSKLRRDLPITVACDTDNRAL